MLSHGAIEDPLPTLQHRRCRTTAFPRLLKKLRCDDPRFNPKSARLYSDPNAPKIASMGCNATTCGPVPRLPYGSACPAWSRACCVLHAIWKPYRCSGFRLIPGMPILNATYGGIWGLLGFDLVEVSNCWIMPRLFVLTVSTSSSPHLYACAFV